jgi:hypothetical protein
MSASRLYRLRGLGGTERNWTELNGTGTRDGSLAQQTSCGDTHTWCKLPNHVSQKRSRHCLKSTTTFRDVMTYSLVGVSWCFGGIYCLHLQGRNVSMRTQAESSADLATRLCSFRTWLIFSYPKNGDDILLRNMGLSLNYTALQFSRP